MNWNEIASAAVTLFLVMDPLGNAPIFNVVLAKLDPKRKMKVIAREMIIALAILLCMLFIGNSMLSFLGLTQPALNIAGGVLLFIISLRMIFPGNGDKSGFEQTEEPFIVPLAMPMVAGPSAIAILLLLSSQNPSLINQWALALFFAWAASTCILLSSSKLLGILGEKGAKAIERLMGMILIMLATQMLLNGFKDFLQSL